MEANEAPEKIYIHPYIGDKGFIRPWLKRPFSVNSIEYTRTDAFIEKACEWLTDNLTNYYLNPVILNDVIHDFKQAMKGE